MPNINEIILKLEGLQYAVSLDLDMIYYHIRIRKKQIIYVQLFSLGGNIVTNVNQWELLIPHTFPNKR